MSRSAPTRMGRSSEFDATNSPGSLRLDPEGLRVSGSGTSAFVSDEFGPLVYEFDLASGTRLRWIVVPPKLLIARPSTDNVAELPPGNTSGRQANRSMEGLAISPDGSKLDGLMQSPMLQDGALNGSNNRIGTNCRLLEMDLATGNTREFLYPLSNVSIGATEVLAINDHEFLVLERDGRGLNSGNSAQFKQVFRIDEKLEGIAFGPDLGDGRHVLIVSADNDFKAGIANWFFAFAIDPQDLPGFVPQVITPVVGVSAARGAMEFTLHSPVPDPTRGRKIIVAG